MKGKTIPYKLAFSKGLVSSIGDNLTPIEYSPFLFNLRHKNGGITNRPGIKLLEQNTGTFNNPVSMIEDNGDVYILANKISTGKLHLLRFRETHIVDPILGRLFDLGNFSLGDSIYYSPMTKMIIYGDYLLILGGFNGESIFVKIKNDPGCTTGNLELPVGFKPIGGETFGNTIILFSGNEIINSLPILPEEPTHCYKFNSTYVKQIETKDGPKTLNVKNNKVLFESEVMGIISSSKVFFVFIEDGRVYQGRYLSTEYGSTIIFDLDEVGKGGKLLNINSIVEIGDKVFFLTKDKKIQTIGYREGVEEREIGTISDNEIVGIEGFLEKLEFNSYSFGYYDQKGKNICFCFPSTEIETKKMGKFKGVVLNYNLVNNTFIPDLGKQYSYGNGNYFLYGDRYEYIPLQDGIRIYKEEGDRDYNQKYNSGNPGFYTTEITEIPWEYQKVITLGDPTIKKQFRGFNVGGKIFKGYNIGVEVDINQGGIVGLDELYKNTDNGMKDFIRNVGPGYIRLKGKKMYILFYKLLNNIEEEIIEADNKFLLDYLSIVVNKEYQGYDYKSKNIPLS